MKRFFSVLVLGPLSLLYGLTVFIRNKLYDWNFFHSTAFDLPVISVGNITVGGTGKTPHTEMLISMLHTTMKIAVLSRGYKRRTKGFRYVEATDTAGQAGDEPLQMKRKFPEVTVAVDVDRIHGIQRLMKDVPDLQAVILDDAFQYRKIRPALSLLMIDYNRPVRKDFYLPLGRLRDSKGQQRRADIIFLTKCPAQLKPIERRVMSKDVHAYPYQQLYFSTFNYGGKRAVFEESNFSQKASEAIAVTGIANPAPFLEQVKREHRLKAHLAFPDHHAFSANDVQKINAVAAQYPEALLLTTEKDALRLYETQGLADEAKQRFFYIPVEVAFLEEADKAKFAKYIVSYVRKNRRNTILYPIG